LTDRGKKDARVTIGICQANQDSTAKNPEGEARGEGIERGIARSASQQREVMERRKHRKNVLEIRGSKGKSRVHGNEESTWPWLIRTTVKRERSKSAAIPKYTIMGGTRSEEDRGIDIGNLEGANLMRRCARDEPLQ